MRATVRRGMQGASVVCFALAWVWAHEHLVVLAWLAAAGAEGTLVYLAFRAHKDAGATESRVAWALVVAGLITAALPIWGRHAVSLPVGVDADPEHAHPLHDIWHAH